MLLFPLSDPAGMGGSHCLPHPERFIENQKYCGVVHCGTAQYRYGKVRYGTVRYSIVWHSMAYYGTV